MTLQELIDELVTIVKVHPDAGGTVVSSRNLLGVKSNHIVVRLKDYMILIEGVSING